MEIYIETDYRNNVKRFWLFDEVGNKRRSYHIDEKNKLTITETEISCTPDPVERKPFLELPMSFAADFIKCIVDSASSQNIKTKEGDFKDGKIEAMEKHLLDMQKIVKKVLKIES